MPAEIPPQVEVCPAHQHAPATVEAAREARFDGDHAQARCVLGRVLVENPQSADAWLELGFVNSASGDADAARAAFLRALEIAPDYDDAKLGLALIAYRAGDLRTARVWFDRIGAERRRDHEINGLRRALAAGERPRATWRWDAFAAYSSLSNNLGPWRDASLAVGRRSGPTSVGLLFERVQRFGLQDTYAEARLSRQFASGTWGAALGGARNPHFRPEAAIRFEYATREDRDTSYEAALTIARYAAGQVDNFSLRARRRLTEPLQVNALGILVRDETGELRTGYGLGATWRMPRQMVIDAGWVDAPESSEGVTIDVRAATLGLSMDVAPDTRVRLGVMREERDAFDRTEFAISLARTF